MIENMNDTPLICPQCHQAVAAEQYFCPNCGKSLREKPIMVSTLAQVGIYAVSILLPPLGYWPGFKYVVKTSPSAKRVGLIAIILTTVSSIASIWAIYAFFQSYLNQINSFMG